MVESSFLRSLCSFAAIFSERRLVAQRGDWVDPAGAEGGQQAGDQGGEPRDRTLSAIDRGSVAETPYRIPATTPDRAKAVASPVTNPIPTILSPWPIINPRSWWIALPTRFLLRSLVSFDSPNRKELRTSQLPLEGERRRKIDSPPLTPFGG